MEIQERRLTASEECVCMSVQVVEHAAAVNKLNAMEAESHAAEQRLQAVRDEILAAQQAKVRR